MNTPLVDITPVPTQEALERKRLRAIVKRERQAKAVAQRRAFVLDEALKLYAELGPDRFHVRELAARTGYTAGALYLYFDGKDAILGALRQRLLQSLAERAGAGKLGKGGTALAVTRAQWVSRCLGWWQLLGHDPHALALLLMPAAADGKPDLADELLATLHGLQDGLEVLGLEDERSARLMSELVIWVVGRLTLARHAATSPLPGALDAEFAQWLNRQLDLLVSSTSGADDGGEGGVAQVALF